jgi:solute:Na+ symporter, SSS family
MMSSADTYMIVTSALVVRNVYAAYIDSDAEEKQYVFLGRVTGLLIIVGAAVVALTYADVFGQFKMAMELPILFAAPFWLGMYWRRANRVAVWGTVLVSLLIFFILPVVVPAVRADLREHPVLTTTTDVITRSFERPATESDVARYRAWHQAHQELEGRFDPSLREGDEFKSLLKSLGASPPQATLGQPITITMKSGGESIFWREGVVPLDESGRPQSTSTREFVDEHREDATLIRTERIVGRQRGVGSLNLDFLLYSLVGFDLSGVSKATLETLRLPARLLTPFLVLFVLSHLTRRDDNVVLDRYFAKMNTPVQADHVADRQALERAYEDPRATESRKLFPGSDWEFVSPTRMDLIGFLASCAACFVIIGLLTWLAGIGG